MNDILEPWCRSHSATFVTAQGQMTLTGAWEAADHRIREREKPAILLYISDFDKSGQSMPLAIARKIERFLRVEYKNHEPPVPPVIVLQVALTYEQVQHYHLPDIPVNDTAWTDRYGIGKVELDALEVYVPGELERLLDEAAAPYWDAELSDRITKAEGALQAELDKVAEKIVEQHREPLDALEARWTEAIDAARKILEPVWAGIQAEQEAIAEELTDEMPDLADYPLPEPPEADPALAETALFDSRRTYWQQKKAYDAYKQEHVVSEE
jgi:hypothetical protein